MAEREETKPEEMTSERDGQDTERQVSNYIKEDSIDSLRTAHQTFGFFIFDPSLTILHLLTIKSVMWQFSQLVSFSRVPKIIGK